MRMRDLLAMNIFKAHGLTSQGKRKINLDRCIPKKREGKAGVCLRVGAC